MFYLYDILLCPYKLTFKIHCRWHFAYESTLGETVRPRRNMWSWENMKRHRKVCREYKEAYRQKQLAGSKIPAPLKEKLEVHTLAA